MKWYAEDATRVHSKYFVNFGYHFYLSLWRVLFLIKKWLVLVEITIQSGFSLAFIHTMWTNRLSAYRGSNNRTWIRGACHYLKYAAIVIHNFQISFPSIWCQIHNYCQCLLKSDPTLKEKSNPLAFNPFIVKSGWGLGPLLGDRYDTEKIWYRYYFLCFYMNILTYREFNRFTHGHSASGDWAVTCEYASNGDMNFLCTEIQLHGIPWANQFPNVSAFLKLYFPSFIEV